MKTAEIIRFPLFSGANDVTRTHDLLITNQLLYRLSYISIFTFGVADLILTKCIGALHLTVFRDFGAFPLGILREVRPILSIVFVRSFPRVGRGVGQADTSASKKPRMGFAVIFCLAVSLS